jgi:hypothetical protein
MLWNYFAHKKSGKHVDTMLDRCEGVEQVDMGWIGEQDSFPLAS